MISIGRSGDRLGFQSGDHYGDKFGLVGFVLVLSSEKSIGRRITRAVGSLIRRSGA